MVTSSKNPMVTDRQEKVSILLIANIEFIILSRKIEGLDFYKVPVWKYRILYDWEG